MNEPYSCTMSQEEGSTIPSKGEFVLSLSKDAPPTAGFIRASLGFPTLREGPRFRKAQLASDSFYKAVRNSIFYETITIRLFYVLTKSQSIIISHLNRFGTWRSLEAHLNGVQGAESSNLSVPTSIYIFDMLSGSAVMLSRFLIFLNHFISPLSREMLWAFNVDFHLASLLSKSRNNLSHSHN